jgi:hypothetical protein
MNAEELAAVRDVDRQENHELAWHLSQATLWCEKYNMVDWYNTDETINTNVRDYGAPSLGR